MPAIDPVTRRRLDFRISIEDCEWRLATQSTGIRRLLGADDRGYAQHSTYNAGRGL